MSFADLSNPHEKLITALRLNPKNASERVSLQSSVECLREYSCAPSPQNLGGQLGALVERTEDFTDSAYTSHEQRQAILGVCQLVRQDTEQLVHAWVEAVRFPREQCSTTAPQLPISPSLAGGVERAAALLKPLFSISEPGCGPHALFLPPPPQQHSAPAKEATEQVEVAILKTCQSISELRREVSARLCLLSKGTQ